MSQICKSVQDSMRGFHSLTEHHCSFTAAIIPPYPKDHASRNLLHLLDLGSLPLHTPLLPMTTDMTAPATKQDIVQLREEMATKQDIAQLREEMATKGDLADLGKKFDSAVQEMKLYFDAANEHFRSDMKAINIEKIGDHDARITHLEIITGVRH